LTPKAVNLTYPTLPTSPHAVSAFAGLMLLAANGALGVVMKDSPQLRTTHAFLGSSLMAMLVVHAGLGLKLALEL
jgi:hypothetical protein